MKIILKKLLLKNLSISLYGLFILEFLYFYPNKIFARDLDKKILKEISINYDQLGSSNVNVSSKISKSTGTSNPHNMLKATLNAFKISESPKSIAAKRSKKISEITNSKNN